MLRAQPISFPILMKQILINSEELQVRVAVVEDGRLQDFFMERNNKDRIVGSIYKGRIKNLEPSLQAAFVDIGIGKNAFLHYWDMLPATPLRRNTGNSFVPPFASLICRPKH